MPPPILAFLLALSACSSDEPKTEVVDDSVPQRIELSRSQQSMVGDQTQVTLDLYSSYNAKRNPNDDNCVFSPVSLEMWYAMIANGTSGATLQKILDAYGADDVNSLNEFNMLLLSELPKLNPSKSKLIFANSLWENTLYSVNQPFKDAISSMFDADLFKYNFKDDKAKKDINKWVEKKTNGIIKEYIPEIAKLDAEKRMALIKRALKKSLFEGNP